MARQEEFEQKLKDILSTSVRDPEVRFVYAGWGGSGWAVSSKVLVSLISSEFEGMDEVDRQSIVWKALMDGLSVEEQRYVEYVYTKAPSEVHPQAVGP